MEQTIVNTGSGPVRGMAIDGVARYLGIPYAAAPVGANRFRAPGPHAHWSEPLDATAFAPTAPQVAVDFPGLDIVPLVGTGWTRGDDFLNLNIWAPATGARDLPVMVFIHGGGWVVGSNRASVSDGTAFARSGILYIAMNYRMGVEGFLPIEGAPTNLGLRDQLQALAWIRDNARAFGGDPGNVTVFGESAGAMSVADLVVSPLAKGLFRRAIIQSGHGSMVRSIPVARRLTHKLAKMLGITPDVAGFSSRTPEQCVDAVSRVQKPTTRIDLRDETGREPAYGLSRFLPVHGDDVIPVPPLEALAAGAGADIEVLIGTNAEEMNLYFVPTGVRPKIGRLLAWFVVSRCAPHAWAVLKAYGMGQAGRRPGDAFTEALHDLVFRHPARAYAAGHRGRLHFYEFGWRSPAFGNGLGACHGLELPFVFNTLASCTGPSGLAGSEPPQALADDVHRIWVDFARHGTVPWGPYTAAERTVYRLDSGRAHVEQELPAARYWP